MTLRQDLYRAARVLGHVQAVNRGRVPQRATNVVLGRLVARLTQRLWR